MFLSAWYACLSYRQSNAAHLRLAFIYVFNWRVCVSYYVYLTCYPVQPQLHSICHAKGDAFRVIEDQLWNYVYCCCLVANDQPKSQLRLLDGKLGQSAALWLIWSICSSVSLFYWMRIGRDIYGRRVLFVWAYIWAQSELIESYEKLLLETLLEDGIKLNNSGVNIYLWLGKMDNLHTLYNELSNWQIDYMFF